MEPQIIDFYNEMPSGVNVIDKLNEEFNNLQNEYNKLKNELEKDKPPKVLYSSYEEWDKTNADAFKLIKKDIHKWVNGEYGGIPFRFKTHHTGLTSILYMSFKLITKEDRYSNKIAYECINRIESFINGLKISNLFDNFYLNNTYDEITDILYDLIIHESLFSEILYLKCPKCEKIDEWLLEPDTNLCVECSHKL